MSRAVKILDLFCGCGGFSLGAHQAGFSTALSIDIDRTLSSSITKNYPHTQLVHFDLGQVSLRDHDAVRSQVIGGIIGGPPCQGFSAIGKRDSEDPRNLLVGHYYRHINEIEPNFFVMENVPGILEGKYKNILMECIETVKKKYEIVGPFEIDASDYGAPTSRKRVIVVGYRREYCDSMSEKDFRASHVTSKTTVKQAIADLPGSKSPEEICEAGYEWARYPRLDDSTIGDYAAESRKKPALDLGWGKAVSQLSDGMLTGNQPTAHSNEISRRYAAVPGGKRDSVSKSFKLEWDAQCPTLRAGTGPDRGSFNAVRPLHPDEGRVITVREAARLQGFPDWFTFHRTKWHSFRMIGNSVSPIVSKAILSVIAEKIGQNNVSDAAQ